MLSLKQAVATFTRNAEANVHLLALNNLHCQTMLMHACLTNNVAAVQCIADACKTHAPAVIDARDADGFTALLHAAELWHVECAAALVAAGADVNMGARVERDYMTALEYALENPEMAELLIRAGAIVNVKDRDGNTPLAMAAEFGNHAVVGLLVDARADATLKNQDNEDAMARAIHRNRLACVPLLMRALRQKADDCAVPLAEIYARRGQRRSPLMDACEKNNVACVRVLLDACDDFNYAATSSRADENRETALTVALTQDNSHACIRALLGAGARATDKALDLARGLPVANEGAQMVIASTVPWSSYEHREMEAPTRARAVEVLKIGYALAKSYEGLPVMDVWVQRIMPLVVPRFC